MNNQNQKYNPQQELHCETTSVKTDVTANERKIINGLFSDLSSYKEEIESILINHLRNNVEDYGYWNGWFDGKNSADCSVVRSKQTISDKLNGLVNKQYNKDTLQNELSKIFNRSVVIETIGGIRNLHIPTRLHDDNGKEVSIEINFLPTREEGCDIMWHIIGIRLK